MAAYDPKRPRPAATDDEAAPVDALLEPAPEPEVVESEVVESDIVETAVEDGTSEPETEPEPEAAEPEPEAAEPEPETAEPEPEVAATVDPVEEDAAGAVVEVDLRDATPNGSAAHIGSEVPVAPAPEEGTANRAVLIAGAATGLLAVVIALLLRRRRRQR